MTNIVRKLFRQGDVLLRQISQAEKRVFLSSFNEDEIKQFSKSYKKFVVRKGESGNCHTLVAEQPFTIIKGLDDNLVIEIKDGVGILKHQEHKALKIPRGTYQVINEREYSYEDNWEREVRD